MSDQFDNNLRGVLFKNKDRTEATPNWPHYQGNAEIDGVKYWVSSWIQTAKTTGEEFMSLSFKPQEQQSAQPKGKAKPEADFNDDISDIPF